ncbi:MAG: helix-turn-helix transcriptional regulator [Oscillospiraceae bacterium]|nr:helix-turn-helix transcriptional regulator [Oscillospiraceae bacterium]
MDGYVGVKLYSDIEIDKLYSVHYFEFASDYKFIGERHDFWEFVYVDKGEVIVTAEDKDIVLKQGNVIFHKPNEWHNIYSNGIIAPNIVVISFSCNSDAMKFFENKLIKVGQAQKEIISKIISEYTNAFSTPLNMLNSRKLTKSQEKLIGSEQLLKMYICEFLISLLRSGVSLKKNPVIQVSSENALLNMIINYMQQNITRSVTVSELVKYSGSNHTSITRLFNQHFNTGIIEYFIGMKIELAKSYLRENNYNVTQISEILGFSSIHYFSRQFKKKVGMSPIEYSNSVLAQTNTYKNLELTEK